MGWIDKVNKKIDDCIKICDEIIKLCNFFKDYELIEKYTGIIEQLETMDLNELNDFAHENLIGLLDNYFEEYKKEKENLIDRCKPEKEKREEIQKKINQVNFNKLKINADGFGFGEVILNGNKLSYVTGFNVTQRIGEKSVVTLEFYSDVDLTIEKDNKKKG